MYAKKEGSRGEGFPGGKDLCKKRHKEACGLMGTGQRNVGNMANSEVVRAPKLCP